MKTGTNYRKKPVVIQAVLWDGKEDTLKTFIGENTQGCDKVWEWEPDGRIAIMTLEGDHIINIGDYIIRGVKGEYYGCKPDVFEMTYELEEKQND